MSYLTSRQIADMLKKRITYHVRQKSIAKALGVSQSYLCDFLAGKREVGPKILKALKFEIVPYYRRKP